MRHQGTAVLQSARLLLRPFTEEDIPIAYCRWMSSKKVTEHVSWAHHRDEEETREVISTWIESYDDEDFYMWAIEEKSLGLIGNIFVCRINARLEEFTLGYALCEEAWGKGLASEALRLVISYLFDEVGAYRIVARRAVENSSSGRVMEKAGMRYEGIMRQKGASYKGTRDLAIYAILATDERSAP